MVTDSVADALIRLKNGYLAFKPEVILSYSKLVVAICQLLQSEGYIEKFEVSKIEGTTKQEIVVKLKYETGFGTNGRRAAIADVKRISKPGLRVYKGKGSLPYVLNGLGMAIISTPRGIMSDKQARKEGVGGEIMAYVW